MDRRQRAQAWARAICATSGVLILDTETTGIGSQDQVIELAVLDTRGNVLLETLVKPSCPIDPAALRVHGLSEAHLARAPEWPLVYRELRAIFDIARLIVTYNAPFDRRLIEQTCRCYGLRLPDLSWDCAMRRFAEYAGPPPTESWRTYHRLSEALDRLGIPHPGVHRAAADAEACRLLVRAMAAGRPLRF